MASKCAIEAVQIHGANGFDEDKYNVAKLLRDSKKFKIIGGTVEIQRMVIAREVFKEHKE